MSHFLPKRWLLPRAITDIRPYGYYSSWKITSKHDQRLTSTTSSSLALLRDNRHRWSSSSASSPSTSPSTVEKVVTTEASTSTIKTKTASVTPSSVSSQEVSKFSNWSSSWWDNSNNPLIAMNPTRVEYIRQHCSFYDNTNNNTKHDSSSIQTNQKEVGLKSFRVLDVGCGGGLLTESLYRLGIRRNTNIPFQVMGIDPSPNLISCAKSHAGNLPIDYRVMTIEELAKQHHKDDTDDDSLSFQLICCLEVLEHVTDVNSIIQSVSQLLDPTNGIFVVSTINSTWKAHVLGVVGAESIMEYLPPGTHDPSKFQSPTQVEQVVQRFGMEPAGPPMGMVLSGLPPPLGPWRWKLSTTDLDVNWIGCYRHRKS